MALGEAAAGRARARRRSSQPLAIRFLTAAPGPLEPGRVTRIGSLEKVLALPGRRPGGHLPRRRDHPAGAPRRRPPRVRDRRRRHEPRGARARRGGGAAARRRGRARVTAGGRVTLPAVSEGVSVASPRPLAGRRPPLRPARSGRLSVAAGCGRDFTQLAQTRAPGGRVELALRVAGRLPHPGWGLAPGRRRFRAVGRQMLRRAMGRSARELRVLARPLPRAARRGEGGGYRLARASTGRPRPRDLILRHDVDLSLEAALEMARGRARAGACVDLVPDDARRSSTTSTRPRATTRIGSCASWRPRGRATTPSGRTSTSTRASSQVHRLAQPRPRVHERSRSSAPST